MQKIDKQMDKDRYEGSVLNSTPLFMTFGYQVKTAWHRRWIICPAFKYDNVELKEMMKERERYSMCVPCVKCDLPISLRQTIYHRRG